MHWVFIDTDKFKYARYSLNFLSPLWGSRRASQGTLGPGLIGPGLSCPHSNSCLTLDQNRQALAYSLFITPLNGRLVLSHRIEYSLDYITFVLHFAVNPKGKRETDLFLLCLFFRWGFYREETYVILLLGQWRIKYVQHIQAWSFFMT